MFSKMNRLKKSGFTMFTVLLSSMLILSGCGSKTEEQKPAAEPAKQEVKYTVKHAMGETPIEGTPEKVVVLTNEGTEALLAMGVKPVGAVKSWTGDPWYAHIKADMEGVQVVGDESQPNLEAIAALQPDLIIGNKMRQEKVYEQLKAIAPTVMSEDLRGNWRKNFTLYAEALNKKAEGDKALADWDARVAEFKTQAGDKLKTEVSMVRFMAGKTRIYYNNTFSGMIFKELGLARPEKQNVEEFAAEVGKERIPEMEGDILFYFTYDTGNGEANKTEQEWLNDSLFKNLEVVKAGKAYKVDDAIWNTAGGIRAANLLLDDLGSYLLK
ncbi:ABC transporter substrate-binding protein [Tumebacillus avium]|uniref:ABC transporter substrate-binding protein n=1 Tax=Tumebacillus avium TaxID=1903704 RepID=A0A1Y0IMN3_9BACL|nr:iron-siderophore ABC transporter substrate-binding protein [Tumebacillus avium]ARU61510.1 ABC transporter substrate-binding protein [Tumebacillus avium]